MKLTDDPLLAHLRGEAEAWHLTQIGRVLRNSTVVIQDRDVEQQAVIYDGPLGVKREKAKGQERVSVELPTTAPALQPGDIVVVDDAPWEQLVVEDFTGDTQNMVINKAACSTRVLPEGVQ